MFGAVLKLRTVVVLAIVGLLVVGGIFVYKFILHERDSPGKTTETVSVRSGRSVNEWFEIPEWGVKFKVPDSIDVNDIGYNYELLSGRYVVVLESKALAAKYEICSAKEAGLMFMIEREKEDIVQKQIVEGGNISTIYKILGDYRYYWSQRLGGPGCAEAAGEEYDKYIPVTKSVFATLTRM